MTDLAKGRSPFLPNQPAGVDVFVGRSEEISRLLDRGAGQTALGKPTAFFVEGEYGIGKSSLANYCLKAAELRHGLLGVSVSLGGLVNLRSAAEAVLKGVISSAARDKNRWQALAEKLGKYVKEFNLFGVVEFNLDALRGEAQAIADVGGFLALLRTVIERLPQQPISQSKGLFLVLDEINGIAAVPEFAHFLKGVVDQNALDANPLAFCLVLCGTAERRQQLIAAHEPVGRIFDVVDVKPLSDVESREFFSRAFASVGMKVDADAMDLLVTRGFGQPRILHMLGDQAFWADTDGTIDLLDAVNALVGAADEFMRKFVGPQILAELRSADYHSILRKICKLDALAASFTRKEIAKSLSDTERGKLDNFLQRMKALGALRQGDSTGEWVFDTPLVRTAVSLWAAAQEQPQK